MGEPTDAEVDAAARAMQRENRSGAGYLNADQQEAADADSLPAYRSLARAALTANRKRGEGSE